jgi:SAM-dependent methyltransferase
MDELQPSDAPRLYDEFAERFETHASTAFWNAHYDRPAVLGMLGSVTGRRVLDAGCGPGLYAEELLARGAHVVAFDASSEMVELARQRAPAAEVHHHDLNQPLDFLADASIDAVVSALVWHYIDERLDALREFRRVLRDGGRVVISCGHPTDDWLRNGGSYFEARHKVEYWSSLDTSFASWHLPLTMLCDEFAEAGFVIERLLEPQPTDEARAVDADEYAHLSTRPGFIVFRLRPD